jgi:hypothetical protein
MTEVSISQALRYASKLKNQISEARKRAESSLIYKLGEQAAFSFSEMLTKADVASFELAALQGKLAAANAENTVEYKGNQISLSHAVRVLQELKGRIAWVRALPCQTTENAVNQERSWDENTDKYILKTSTTVCALPEAKRAELADSLQEEFDSLNGSVELANQVVKLTI